MYGKYEYFVRTAVPGTWYIPGVRVPGRWYSYVVQSIILVVTPVSFSIMSGNIMNVFYLYSETTFFTFPARVVYVSTYRPDTRCKIDICFGGCYNTSDLPTGTGRIPFYCNRNYYPHPSNLAHTSCRSTSTSAVRQTVGIMTSSCRVSTTGRRTFPGG